MTWTATWKRLHRFFAVLIILALPLQGQAVASMSCHTSPLELSALKVSAAKRTVHSHDHAQHQHDDHQHHASSSSKVDTPTNTDLTANATGALATALNDTPPAAAETCALCTAGCTVALPLPVFEKTLSLTITDHQQPAAWTTSAYAGVVLDGLLRPPR